MEEKLNKDQLDMILKNPPYNTDTFPFDENTHDKIEVPLDEHTKLVAWKDTVTEFNEISVYIEKDGYIYQDLALVRQKSDIQNDEICFLPGQYEVIVWADENNEDYTHKFEVAEHVEPEEDE